MLLQDPETQDTPETITLEDSQATIMRSLQDLWHDAVARLPQVAIGLAVLGATWVVTRIAMWAGRRLLDRTHLRGSLKDLILQLGQAALWVGGMMVAAIVIFPGVTPGKLLTVLGLGSIAIGFAFKDIFENFFAGILILWRFPFERGDHIEVEGVTGSVERVTIRMTEIRQTDGQLVVLPNGHLFKNAVRVVTSLDQRRTTIAVGVAYGEDVDTARGVIDEAVRACDTVTGDRPVEIFAQNFGASSIDFEVTWWTGSTPLDVRKSRDEVVAAVKRALDDAEIEIPFPYRTLTFSQPLEIHQHTNDPETPVS